MGTWSWDVETGNVEWDAEMAARFGIASDEFTGRYADFIERIHPDDRAQVEAEIAATSETGLDLAFEHRAVWPDGSIHWIESRGRPVHDDDGRLVAMVGVGIDIDGRKWMEAYALEEAELRAAAVVARDLNEAERIAALGSWQWDRESQLVSLSTELARMLELPRTMTGPEYNIALRKLAHPDDGEELTRYPAESLGHRRRRYATETRMILRGEVRHVVHRGEVLFDDDGQIVRVRGTAQDVTRQREAQAALARAEFRLAQERHAVGVLQETFLQPVFPPVDGYEIGASYLAADYDGDIGGDWYDAFALPDGRIMTTVGDVSGHGIGAARLMATLRHATRAYASIEPDIGRVLAHLDEFLDQFGDADQIATLLFARLDPATGTVELGSAGHPPPLLVADDGSTVLAVRPRPALGAGTTSDQVEILSTQLQPGQALLLYTDGLVERRGESLDTGIGRLRAATLDDADDAHELCSRAIDACLTGADRRDDVCVLAVRRLDVHVGCGAP